MGGRGCGEMGRVGGGGGGIVRRNGAGEISMLLQFDVNYLFKINVRTFTSANCFLFGEVNILVHFDAELLV